MEPEKSPDNKAILNKKKIIWAIFIPDPKYIIELE